MRQLLLPFLLVALLAACSSTPQKSVRNGEGAYASGAERTRPPGLPNFVDHSVGREEISIQAMSLVGIPYRWGGNTPDSGFDCSGLVQYVVGRAASVTLPRTTADMSSRGETIEPDEIAAGDLIFFNTTGRAHSHVGIYVGKLRFVNAPSTGGTVRLDYLTNPYWAKRFDGIRRVAPAKRAPSLFDAPTYEASTPPAASAPAYAAAAPGYGAGAVVRGTNTAPAGAVYQPVQAGAAAYAAAPAPVVRTAPMTPAAGVAGAPSPSVAAQPPTDAFEPPPPALSTAQTQARAAGAIAPPAVASPGTSASAQQTNAPDVIDAAADAFEPPPPATVAARQAVDAQQPLRPPQAQAAPAPGQVQIIRASTINALPAPPPASASDDPIARFATSGY